ncbi:MAG: HNH endonuclease [Clostridia bacterium]|nr:HNH endonuclease [Clostridia bacterium]
MNSFNLPQSEQLNTQCLARIFDNKSESYKLFWFKAILEHVLKGETEISFDSLVNSMIKNAWYMVSEYKLNLGPADAIEETVLHLHTISGIAPSEKEDKIISFIKQCNDPKFISLKKRLCTMVPYRLQAPFMSDMPSPVWKKRSSVIEYINGQQGMIYYLEPGNSILDMRVLVTPLWADYLKANAGILMGWIDYNMIIYLQRRNPSVPGISSKLYPPQARQLGAAKVYWKAVIRASQVKKPLLDIYSDEILAEKSISIDHFIPWSYVAHDELWNLIPTTRSINSSKSNNLPEWKTYFHRLCETEYFAYQLVNEYDHMRDLQEAVEKCMKDHVNDAEVRHKLYRPGQSQLEFSNRLEEIVFPAYESARNMGFGIWKYEL